jgi:hypothetical protein
MRKYVALLALTLILTGCDTRDKTQELQQQKLTLDLIKAQNEQLAATMKSQEEKSAVLSKKESDLNNWEKRLQEALQENERQKSAIERLQEQIVQEKIAIKTEGERLEVERKKVRADELKNQKDREEIDQKITAIREREEAERKAKGIVTIPASNYFRERAEAKRQSTGIVTTPVTTYFNSLERIMFEITIPDALRAYKFEHDFKGPITNEEFMEQVIKKNSINLPALPSGHKYVYDSIAEKLMVERSPITETNK